MKIRLVPLCAVAVIGAIATTPACACDDGHWIQEVLADGQILKLEDGSMWKVDPTDTPTSSLWLAVSDVIVCDDEIVNVDDGEKVQVTRIR
ncbi:hypothetical protein [Bradyrhizobium sp. CCBAU 43298]|uniref:hypothetical protein n=1 Tax=Bradyrhizobium TaxID=374 RepID=UPI0012F83233|nr:hypothetical protein [Bradyrhizobium sp. CCBAU 43298]